jgi:hypothetical protein
VAAPHVFVLRNQWALGDTVCLSALVRDVHRAHPGRYVLDMLGHYPSFWRNNPNVRRASDEAVGQLVTLEYVEGIKAAGRGVRHHFLRYFHEEFHRRTGVRVPVTEPKGDVHLAADEKVPMFPGRYWVVVAGGKKDMTAKVWHAARWQRVVDTLAAHGVRCVQAGARFRNDYHPVLQNCESAVGKTDDIRALMGLVHNAEGVLCGVTAAMHLAAAFDKPCVVVAGGREEPWWEAYTNAFAPDAFGPGCAPVKVEHEFLHTVGAIDCGVGNLTKGCWKDRTVPIELSDLIVARNKNQLCRDPVRTGDHPVPACLDRIEVDHVVEAVMRYYESGLLPPVLAPTRKYALPLASPTPDVGAYPKEFARATQTRPDLAAMDHPYVGGRFTVCVLGHGDHTDLLQRCVGSIVDTLRRSGATCGSRSTSRARRWPTTPWGSTRRARSPGCTGTTPTGGSTRPCGSCSGTRTPRSRPSTSSGSTTTAGARTGPGRRSSPSASPPTTRTAAGSTAPGSSTT